MKLILFGNDHQESNLPAIVQLIDGLLARQVNVVVESDFYRYLNSSRHTFSREVQQAPAHDLPGDIDAALSLGGDGTFLTTVMWVAQLGIPIMGINAGHLGYLAACSLSDAPEAISELLSGDCEVQLRSMLQVRCEGVEIEHPYALNDVAILRQDTSSMIEMETTLQGQPLTTYKGDGLVVCTPTGSTAYNLSAGGPILEPTTQCMALSPLSPHSLTMRPLVIPMTSVVSIVTRTRADYYQVSVDGEAFTCPSGSMVTISEAPLKVRVIVRRGHHFASTLRHKLHWGF